MPTRGRDKEQRQKRIADRPDQAQKRGNAGELTDEALIEAAEEIGIELPEKERQKRQERRRHVERMEDE